MGQPLERLASGRQRMKTLPDFTAIADHQPTASADRSKALQDPLAEENGSVFK
jgi:hypothetical protein